jgi:hypothetical protein
MLLHGNEHPFALWTCQPDYVCAYPLAGGYFTTPAAALAYYPVWSTARGLVSQHGTELLPKDAAVTLFVPSACNMAWKHCSICVRACNMHAQHHHC